MYIVNQQIHENIFLQAMNVEDNDDDDGDAGLTDGMLCAAGTILLLIIITLIIRHRRKLKRQYKKENTYELWQSRSPIYKATTTTKI